MKNIYLTLAIAGTIIPYVFFFMFFNENGMALPSFIAALFVNGAAGGATADLVISSAAFWCWLFASRAERAWLYVILNLAIGLSCALPLYLYFAASRQPSQ